MWTTHSQSYIECYWPSHHKIYSPHLLSGLWQIQPLYVGLIHCDSNLYQVTMGPSWVAIYTTDSLVPACHASCHSRALWPCLILLLACRLHTQTHTHTHTYTHARTHTRTHAHIRTHTHTHTHTHANTHIHNYDALHPITMPCKPTQEVQIFRQDGSTTDGIHLVWRFCHGNHGANVLCRGLARRIG